MTLEQFRKLEEMEQIELLWPLPVIGHRMENGYQVLLFQLDSFYVELYHHMLRDSLEKLRAFADTQYLDIYLEKINIAELNDLVDPG